MGKEKSFVLYHSYCFLRGVSSSGVEKLNTKLSLIVCLSLLVAFSGKEITHETVHGIGLKIESVG